MIGYSEQEMGGEERKVHVLTTSIEQEFSTARQAIPSILPIVFIICLFKYLFQTQAYLN